MLDASVPNRYMREESEEKVLILLYTPHKSKRDWGLGPGDDLFKSLKCPVKTCAFTTDRGLLDDAPVVMFHVPELKTDLNPPPRSRNRPQAWVFYTHTSPAYSHQPPYLWQHLFNWSMTYHPEAEVHFPFGRLRHRSARQPKNYLAVAKEERKMVAWFVGSCKSHSKREAYVERLKRVVPVDTFGECGDHECDDAEGCLEMVGKSYKFYLSFESSLCEGYVTEDFFQHAKLDVVPIVRGGANYSNFMPKNSFINTEDFQTANELGRYLTFLASNPEEYAKYLEWKNYYSVEVTITKDKSWCYLCEKAHDVTSVKKRHNPYEFWFQGKACWTPSDIL
ncbi:alpha-(1,3)-fucosyltransferase C-like [Liolophura sinensis]|uniref:alpha-(1,3)-fucosyltransferase C-like n=1 Tax=Liolophura sinensis TaxID=3198878 RepID=UPI003158E551